MGNKDEANRNWGIIISNNKTEDGLIKRNVDIAPMYDFEACLQDKHVYDEREMNNKTDLKEFIAYYSKEKWFNEWVNDKVINLDMENVYRGVLATSKINVPDNYKKEFKGKIQQSINIIKNVYNKEIEQGER